MNVIMICNYPRLIYDINYFLIIGTTILKMLVEQIVLQDSFDDPKMYSCTPEQLERDVEGDCGRSFHKDEKDDRNTVSGYMNRIPHTSSTRDKEMIKRVPFAKEKDELLPLPSDSSAEYRRDSRTRSPVSAVDGASGIHQGGRYVIVVKWAGICISFVLFYKLQFCDVFNLFGKYQKVRKEKRTYGLCGVLL